MEELFNGDGRLLEMLTRDVRSIQRVNQQAVLTFRHRIDGMERRVERSGDSLTLRGELAKAKLELAKCESMVDACARWLKENR